jgi:hypothetical protein
MNTSDIARDACRIGGLKALEFFHQRDQLTIDLKGPAGLRERSRPNRRNRDD